MRAAFGAKLTRKPEPGSRSLANKSENEVRNLIKSRITNRSGKRQDERDSHELNSGSQPNNHASPAPGTKHKRQATSTKSEALPDHECKKKATDLAPKITNRECGFL
ncbi:uncharacterized protein UMAG_02174 [Mycosarcoma maydis]|uniref:Uncharacterized protein n=1 Tax=Mycosarcoma maydis TaxID=5270 RepID=A0A0D1E5K1_MYCMD|nr:uncharacterized protein UMAG_02174 [Ustilago maydis 521]KIS69640.1 hypothetical protein UMAG_02174 [Ustilago maydis 521]|eukprot:XP_011388525.1 hypothetical protein UMAG_02174 [Ustilago maydis 521]